METIQGEEACRNCQVILSYDYQLEDNRWNGKVGGDYAVKEEDQVFLECPSCGARNFLKLGDDQRFRFSHQDF
jgi:Zn finger protein HypA/HybF involved in hydrogenase expression